MAVDLPCRQEILQKKLHKVGRWDGGDTPPPHTQPSRPREQKSGLQKRLKSHQASQELPCGAPRPDDATGPQTQTRARAHTHTHAPTNTETEE